MKLARPSMNMSRLQSAQLKLACHHLFRCRNFAPAWVMVTWWKMATRLILALACQRKLSPNLMLLLALNGTSSFHAIKKREGQEGETPLCHVKYAFVKFTSSRSYWTQNCYCVHNCNCTAFCRFDKQVRYESRKARADSRLRIKGRFAKANQIWALILQYILHLRRKDEH